MVSTLNLNLLPKALPVSRTEQIMQKLSVFKNLSNYTNIAKNAKTVHCLSLFIIIYILSIFGILNLLIFCITEKQFLRFSQINIFEMSKIAVSEGQSEHGTSPFWMVSKVICKSLIVPWQCWKKNTLDQWMTDSLTS